MKTKINQLVAAVIFTLLLIGGSSYAEGTELIASSLETIEEPALEMENWMVDDVCWNKTNTARIFEETTDKSLVLEAWMTDENTWENIGMGNTKNEVEASLVLEPWMINENLWGKESLSYTSTETENDLVLESWMTNIWNIQ